MKRNMKDKIETIAAKATYWAILAILSTAAACLLYLFVVAILIFA